MQREFIAVSVALLVAGGTAQASPPTAFEDFESIAPKDTPLPTLVTAVGTFTPFAGVPFSNVWVASPGYTNFGPGNNPTTSSILTANGDEGWWLDLAFPAREVSLDIYLNDLGPAEISFYGSSMNWMLSVTYPADADSTTTSGAS